ncbi:hypothetical protein [Lactiplantibacillus plantarum]|nr:hypothetical protein [Lactiplantibacillus plantarum]
MKFDFTIGSNVFINVSRQQVQDIARKWGAQHGKSNLSFKCN